MNKKLNSLNSLSSLSTSPKKMLHKSSTFSSFTSEKANKLGAWLSQWGERRRKPTSILKTSKSLQLGELHFPKKTIATSVDCIASSVFVPRLFSYSFKMFSINVELLFAQTVILKFYRTLFIILFQNILLS